VTALDIVSGGHRLHADVYGELPAERVAILVHGQNWDASGWEPYARAFPEAGVSAVALDLRGYGTSEGATDKYTPERDWSPVTDLRAAKSAIRARCGERVRIALVGCSMGGHAVLASSFERDVDAVVSVSAPVEPVADELSKRVSGRKLYVCASEDRGGATAHVLASFAALERPKELRIFDGTEHSIGMFKAPYGRRVIEAIVEFVCQPA